eukprot:gnl/TRDRNA2_/TRDRNA2_137346_c1_seq1.p1 gnl/TRDRNA2_/TRDRNA2_137346_c1~~gnl/TRDRNA2_/TRDRNA2_137346_c1_seq1.p1  ORF type:complete len:263 (-),score=15.02 gnl/TRDRNA2_/TRDRNA2_137346_c1_seq1:215-1003(-)
MSMAQYLKELPAHEQGQWKTKYTLNSKDNCKYRVDTDKEGREKKHAEFQVLGQDLQYGTVAQRMLDVNHSIVEGQLSLQMGFEPNVHRPLHGDALDHGLFSCQVDGAKTWFLMPPEYETLLDDPIEEMLAESYPQVLEAHDRCFSFDPTNDDDDRSRGYPDLRKAPRPLELRLEAGDCLAMPPNWFHTTRYHGRSIGLDVWWLPLEADKEIRLASGLDGNRGLKADPVSAIFHAIETQQGKTPVRFETSCADCGCQDNGQYR